MNNNNWSLEISKLFKGTGKDEKALHTKAIAIYKANMRLINTNETSEAYPCYIRFSNASSYKENKSNVLEGLLGCGIVALDNDETPLFAMTGVTDKKFPLTTPKMLYEFFKGIIEQSYTTIILAFVKRFKFISLMSLLISGTKVHPSVFTTYYSGLRYKDINDTFAEYKLNWENDENENENEKDIRCNVYKNDKKIAYIYNLKELKGKEFDEVNTWTFLPKKGTPAPYDMIGIIRAEVYDIMWKWRGSPKHRLI